MKNPLLLTSLFAFSTSAFAADVDLSKLPPASDKTGLTYAKDVKPIFEGTCFRCHGDQRPRGGLRLDSLAAALKGGDDGKVITPGDSKKSPLVIAVAQLDKEKAMPPQRGLGGGGKGQGGDNKGGGGKGFPGGDGKGTPGKGGDGKFPGKGQGGQGGFGQMAKPLTPEQVGLIRAWIDQGAK